MRSSSRLGRLAALAALIAATVATMLVRPTSAADEASPPPTRPHRITFWTDCDWLLRISSPQLKTWKSRGVGGFVCMTGRLWGMGGGNAFTARKNADLSASRYAFQRRLRSTRIARRAKAHGLKMYLGVYLVNTHNTSTPLREWFDDRGWTDEVIPRIRDVAAVARRYGFDGIAFDGELYEQQDSQRSATWEEDYPGNSQRLDATRAKARQRGHQLMTAIVRVFPGVELVNYWLEFPDSWQAFARNTLRGGTGYFADSLMPSFWDGITSVRGYAAIRFYDHAFYKSPLLPGATWDAANQYNANAWYSSLSRTWSNWGYASSRFHLTPFIWIDQGPDADEFARPSAEVAEQLQAARTWSTGGEFGNLAYVGPSQFDYGPYVTALREAARPGVVDSAPPALRVSSPTSRRSFSTTAPFLELRGIATDNLAVRAIRWNNGGDRGGIARMTWRILGGDYRTRYRWVMEWSIGRLPLKVGVNRITLIAEDIKGLSRRQALSVTRRLRPSSNS